jgi:ferrochelatase
MSKTAMLLVNLGSPDSYEKKDVKTYLNEFLMDERVIDLKPFARKLLVEGIILNTRPKKSAAAYKSIWWDEGAPLIVLSERLLARVRANSDIPVALGMRYGNPSIKNGFQELVAAHPDLEEILVVPLYPHYAMSSYETVVEKAKEVQQAFYPNIKLHFKAPFYNDPQYIHILAEAIRPALEAPFDHLLFSYHGIPERHVKKSDVTGSHCLSTANCCQVVSDAHHFCYRHQCFQTTELVARELGLGMTQYSVSFQSRLGTDPWLRPFTDKALKSFGKAGMKKLLVVCPAFVSDCLETLEEIEEEGMEDFKEAGGGDFHMIPCLNDREDWAKLIASWGQKAFA